ncbi:Protein PXR1 [Erysiphe neolycopersici]|uniref:PinX1-related protein 1 n=1 Tax=Erysiphe neolycopersici TaxID=212602 RepID=A0A420HI28_9PEZI|nr:Protein PXR1 [Erysiphe neolycopersici]
MGLAAPKKKTRLSYDPNNTRWINDTQSFGHKILTSQGWKKGEFLGAKNAAHSEFHTAANSSHIRVTLKDNNLGLGAKIGTGVGHGECTGLDAFKNLLGRLNGKTQTQIAQEQKVRVDIRRAIYTEKRWGTMNFVSGGYLVGDKIQNLTDIENKRKLEGADKDDAVPKKLEQCKSISKSSLKDEECSVSKKSKKSKKRKASMINEYDTDSNHSKSNKKQIIHPDSNDSNDSNDLSLISKTDKAMSKKSSRSKIAHEIEHGDIIKKEEQTKKKRKKDGLESLAKKVEKLPKEKRNSKRGKILSEPQTVHNSCLSISSDCIEKPSPPKEKPKHENPILFRGRHAIRARNIAQKKLSAMDMASLNQAR